MTVAVVGAGLAGAACARALAGGGVDVRVLDRGRVPGGRMASPTLGAPAGEGAGGRSPGRPVDVGASYLTVRDPRFQAVVDDWVRRGLARPWTDAFHLAGPAGLGERKAGPLRYGTPDGLRSLVLDLLADLPVRRHVEVTRVGSGVSGPTVDGTAYDAVVLAMPDPQAERLLDPALAAERAAVTGRAWEPVLALAAGWAGRCWDDAFDGCFVEGSEQVAWIADDGRRRGDGAAVLVAHSTSPYAARHLAERDAAEPALLAAARRVLDLPAAPAWTHLQRWSFARPTGSRDAPFHLGESRVGLCGDGWGAPRVETAWLSGHLLGQELARRLGRGPVSR